jgi:hypothetical protein
MAMHCPRCLAEYREGFSECTDCHVRLAPGLAPSPPTSQHEVDVASVLESSDPFVIDLAKATLEDAGIEYIEGGDDAAERRLTGMTAAGAVMTRLQVESARAGEARDLLEPLLNPQPVDEDEAEQEA